MYTYQYRLRDRYQVDVVSLAVLADTRDSFRPSCFYYQRWGCEVNFTYPTAKLIDWENRWSELESSENVFALVVRAQIHAKRIKDGASRKQVKIGLVRLLYERGYSREQVVELFAIIDWMIQLPEGLQKLLQTQLQLKFGELPAWAQQRLHQASGKQLTAWAAAILTADNLESMLGQH